MTEDEQLALAVKISQQEQANHVKHRQEEDELLRKAIEESLHVNILNHIFRCTPVLEERGRYFELLKLHSEGSKERFCVKYV